MERHGHSQSFSAPTVRINYNTSILGTQTRTITNGIVEYVSRPKIGTPSTVEISGSGAIFYTFGPSHPTSKPDNISCFRYTGPIDLTFAKHRKCNTLIITSFEIEDGRINANVQSNVVVVKFNIENRRRNGSNLKIIHNLGWPWPYSVNPLSQIRENSYPGIVEGGGRFKVNGSEDSFWVGGYYGPKTQIDENKLRAMANDLPDHVNYQMNIETRPISGVETSLYTIAANAISNPGQPQWQQALDDLFALQEQFYTVVKEENPTIEISYYNFTPIREYWIPVEYELAVESGNAGAIATKYAAMEAWFARNDKFQPLVDFIDILCPSLYRFYEEQHPGYIKWNIIEAKRMGGNKLIIPEVWSHFHNSNTTPLGDGSVVRDYAQPMATWMTDIRWIRQYGGDGIYIWVVDSEEYLTKAIELQFEDNIVYEPNQPLLPRV